MISHYFLCRNLDFIFYEQSLRLEKDTVAEHSVQESYQAASDFNCDECFLRQLNRMSNSENHIKSPAFKH